MNKTERKRIAAIRDGYRCEAKEQLNALQAMIECCDGRNERDLMVMALAAENTAMTVKRLCRLNFGLRKLYQRKRTENGLA